MNYQDIPKAELIKELRKLQREYDSLKTSFNKANTRNKKTEKEFRESEEWFRMLADTTSTCIIIYQGEQMVYVNKANLMLTGFTEKEILNMRFWDLIHHDYQELVRKRGLARQIGEQVLNRYEVKIVCKDGEERWIDFTAGKIEWRGKPAVLGTACDITEHKQVESSLKQALEWKEAIFEGSRDAVFISDQDSCFVAVNNAASYLTGYSREQLLKMRIPDIHDLSDLEAYKMYHQRIFGGEEILSEAKILQSDGTKTDTEFSNRCVSIAGKSYMHTTARNITERKQADEALKNLLSLTEAILESIHNGILVISLQGSVIKTNTRFAEMWMIPEDILKSGNDNILLEYVLEQLADPDAYIAKVKELYENPEAESFDLVYFKDGRIFGRISRPMCLGGEPKARVWSFFDITERKLAEEALHLEKENFRHSLDDSPLGVCIVTLEGKTIYANKTILDIYGYDSFEELQKTHLKDRYTSESYQQSQKRKELRERGDLSATDYEISIVRKDGEIRHLHVNRKEVLWNGVNQFQVIYEDITRRKFAEASLKESEARFRSLFENSFVGISIGRPGGELLHVNNAYARMYGYESPEEVLAEVHQTEVFFENPKEREEVILELKRNGFIEAREFELVRRDGSHFFALVSASEIRDSEGKLLYYQATHIDLTDRKKMEEELRNSKELLEKLNIHQTEIREEERASISREIHDQLGQSMTALKLDLNRMHKYINTNPEAVTKLESMIELVSDTIKDVQRISSDLRPGILDELGLVSAIEWYCDEFEKRTGIKCILKLDDSDFNDSKINLVFFRILQETLTNVIRHAKASCVSIKLNQSKKGVTLTIHDNGIGITSEMIGSSKSLGLISMRERVKQFNGTIDISSKKGTGTKLIIFIPS